MIHTGSLQSWGTRPDRVKSGPWISGKPSSWMSKVKRRPWETAFRKKEQNWPGRSLVIRSIEHKKSCKDGKNLKGKKQIHRQWNQGQVSWKEQRGVWLCSDGVRKAKAQLEPLVSGSMSKWGSLTRVTLREQCCLMFTSMTEGRGLSAALEIWATSKSTSAHSQAERRQVPPSSFKNSEPPWA